MPPIVGSDSISSVADIYAQLQQQGRSSGHRYLIFVSGTESWCETQLLSLPGALDKCLLVANQVLCGVAPSHSENTLGSEFSSLIVNAHNHQKLNEWLAAAGCLTSGGILLLLCPPFSQWPMHFAAQSGQRSNLPSSFIRRLLSIAPRCNGVLCLEQSTGLSGDIPNMAAPWQQKLPTADQQAALAAIKRVVTGRAKRPLVIRSDRGRGKTSVLGLALADLFLSQNNSGGICRRVLITAPSLSAVEGAFAHLSAALPAARWEDGNLVFESCNLRYLPIDAALQSRQPWDLVLVDEAAALPVAALRLLLLRYPRIVFSSTVHGYEGSGRGFDIRFREILDEERPQWRRQTLKEPIRWSVGDPLEQTLNQLFLLDAEPRSPEYEPEGVDVRLVSGDELRNDDLLRQIFGLLVQAHYQTTPQDLQYLLDGDAVIIIACVGACVLGVCQLLPEGGFPERLAVEVVNGRRRPPGHLAAQRLANSTAKTAYLTSQSLRINRIAVMAGSRRKGLGRAMLNAAEGYARGRNLAYLSSSFAADAQLIEFWLAQDFSPAYLGSRRDSASGLYSLIVVKALSPTLDVLQLAQQLHSDLLLSLTSVYPTISAELLISLLAASGRPSRNVPYSAISTVQRYCTGALTFEQAAASMARLCITVDMRTLVGAELVFARVLLGHDWLVLAERFELAGRAEVESCLKQFFQYLISTLV